MKTNQQLIKEINSLISNYKDCVMSLKTDLKSSYDRGNLHDTDIVKNKIDLMHRFIGDLGLLLTL